MELSVAPMMGWTTRHQRYLARLLSKRAVLYTEMVVDKCLVHNIDYTDKLQRWLGYDDQVEHPVVLQLGGNDADSMALAAELGEKWGYDEININVGCPSRTVAQKGCFGAALMLEAPLVRNIVRSIQRRVEIPVTVKCRLGVDNHDSYEFARDFISAIPECDHFIVHARKCLLKGLSTAQNRSIPPLNYERVYRLCDDFPSLKFTINGGIQSVQSILSIAQEQPRLHGAMVGRAAFKNPCLLAVAENALGGSDSYEDLTRRKVIEEYLGYCERMQDEGHDARSLLEPLSTICHDTPASKAFRTAINCSITNKRNGVNNIAHICDNAIAAAGDDILDAPILEGFSRMESYAENVG